MNAPAWQRRWAHRPAPVQAGFTLVELMVIMATVAILVAIAIPSYMGYTARAKMSEIMLATSGCTKAVSDVYLTASSTPGANNWGCESAAPTTKYVSSISTDADGAVTVVADGFHNAAIDGKQIVMTPYKSDTIRMNSADAGNPVFKWVCGPGSPGIPSNYLPASCRG